MNIKQYKNLILNKNFMKIIVAGFISAFGSKLSYFALLKKVYDLSGGRVTDLGFLAIAEFIPYMLFGAIAGIVIDRFSRKKIMIISDMLSGLTVVSIMFVNNLSLIYVVSFAMAFVNVFRVPAQRAFEPNLVKKKDITLLNSFTSMFNSLILIIGSALGAAIVGFIGVKNAFVLDAISFYISAIIIFNVTYREHHIKEEKSQRIKNYISEFIGGVSIMWTDNTLKLIFLIDFFVNFAMSLQPPLLYIFLKQTLNMGNRAELAWGTLLSSLGIGTVLGSLVLGIVLKKYRNKFKLYLNILMLDATFFTLFLLNRYFPISILIFAFLGCIGSAHNIILISTIQSSVSDDNRGKVFSAYAIISSPISIISILIGTTAAQLITAQYVLLTVAGLEAVIAVGVRFTQLYKIFERQAKLEGY